ncbi:MAG: isopentenyl-diphosphate Delta-isomerase [Patescibacteria group bacterium]
MEELVVLVDENNNQLGTVPRDQVHGKDTPLHRAFPLFLFNSKGELLLTRRALNKKTFPGVWTNTVCGHPGPDESNIEAAKRRLKDELGIDLERSHLARQGETFLKEVAPYRYRFTDANGIVENEICPILIGYADSNPQPNLQEVSEWKWVKWERFLEEIKQGTQIYSPWSVEEAQIIQKQGVNP